MKITLIFLFAFCLGMKFQKWDSKHGADVGYKAGVATREFFIKQKGKTP